MSFQVTVSFMELEENISWHNCIKLWLDNNRAIIYITIQALISIQGYSKCILLLSLMFSLPNVIFSALRSIVVVGFVRIDGLVGLLLWTNCAFHRFLPNIPFNLLGENIYHIIFAVGDVYDVCCIVIQIDYLT